MEDWFSYVMSVFHMAFQNAVFFMATLRNALAVLDDLWFAAVVSGVFGVFVILLAALVGMSRRLGRSADAIRLLNDDLAQVTQDLHVERVWRLAGGDGSPIGQCMPPGSVQRFRDNDMHSNKGLKARRMNQI
jgi:hypothetical protein